MTTNSNENERIDCIESCIDDANNSCTCKCKDNASDNCACKCKDKASDNCTCKCKDKASDNCTCNCIDDASNNTNGNCIDDTSNNTNGNCIDDASDNCTSSQINNPQTTTKRSLIEIYDEFFVDPILEKKFNADEPMLDTLIQEEEDTKIRTTAINKLDKLYPSRRTDECEDRCLGDIYNALVACECMAKSRVDFLKMALPIKYMTIIASHNPKRDSSILETWIDAIMMRNEVIGRWW